MNDSKVASPIEDMTIIELLEFIETKQPNKGNETLNLPYWSRRWMSKKPVELLMYAKELSLKPEAKQETKGPDKPKSNRERFLDGDDYAIRFFPNFFKPRFKYTSEQKELLFKPSQSYPSFMPFGKIEKIDDIGFSAISCEGTKGLDLKWDDITFEKERDDKGNSSDLEYLRSKFTPYGFSAAENLEGLLSKLRNIPGISVDIIKMPWGQKH